MSWDNKNPADSTLNAGRKTRWPVFDGFKGLSLEHPAQGYIYPSVFLQYEDGPIWPPFYFDAGGALLLYLLVTRIVSLLSEFQFLATIFAPLAIFFTRLGVMHHNLLQNQERHIKENDFAWHAGVTKINSWLYFFKYRLNWNLKLKILTPRENENSMKHNKIKRNFCNRNWYLIPKMFTHVNTAAALLNPITFRHCSDIIAGSLEAAYSLNWGAREIWRKGGGETLALLW